MYERFPVRSAAPARARAATRVAELSGGGGIRTLGSGVTTTTVFETAPFNHSGTPPGRPGRVAEAGRPGPLAPGAEEVEQEGGAVRRQHAAGHVRPVVQARLGEDVEDASRGARLRVGGAVDDA